MRLLRDLGRRKLRSTLTISGILIGIMALVVFGSMASKIGSLVQGGSDYYRNKVVVSAKGGTMGFGAPLAISTAAQVAHLSGVDVVVPGVSLLLSDDTSGVSMGTPAMITGSIAGADRSRETFPLHYASGRALTVRDEGSNVTVLGSDLARQYKMQVGDSITLRGESFTVVGILEPTLTAPDGDAMVPLAAAQRLYLTTLPPLVAGKLSPSEVATGLTVYPASGTSPATIAAEITAAIPGVSTMTGADFDKEIGSSTAILNSILVGIGLISLLVGGLSVVNTMAMSVAERTREIGIKRAIGASRWRIRREIVAESALIGLIGGLLGLAVGALIVSVGNEAGRASGTILFELTAGTAISSVAFATVLGAFAGLVPAWHASGLDPVTALRYE
ncbi:MAG: ABC transporter permease [Candidatus Limnocylindrales bacterium]